MPATLSHHHCLCTAWDGPCLGRLPGGLQKVTALPEMLGSPLKTVILNFEAGGGCKNSCSEAHEMKSYDVKALGKLQSTAPMRSYYQHPHILKIGGCPDHVHQLSMEVGVGQTTDIWLGQEGHIYIYVCVCVYLSIYISIFPLSGPKVKLVAPTLC